MVTYEDRILTTDFHLAGHAGAMQAVRAAATLAVLSLSLSACGGGSSADDTDSTDDIVDVFREAANDAGGTGGDGPDDTPAAGNETADAGSGIRAPEFLLTGSFSPPAGWTLDPANCVAYGESGPPFFDYYVPGDWIRRSAGGSGAGVTMNGDHTYELPDGTRLTIDIEIDAYDGTDPIGADNRPWTSWDYDITMYEESGERTVSVVYDERSPVEIDGETFDLYALDQAQSDQLSASEYKTRIVFADVPTGGPAGRDRRPESATVTFSWNAANGAVDEATVRDILSSFRVATCAQEGLVELYEILTGSVFS